MFPVCMAPGPHSSISEEFQHSTILRPQKPIGSWNLVSPLFRINEALTNECAARLQPLADQYKTPTTPNFRNRKIPRFDRNNPIMSMEKKYLFFVSLLTWGNIILYSDICPDKPQSDTFPDLKH